MAYRDSKPGGWKGGSKFGDKKPWERGGGRGDFAKPMMHSATCAECNASCEVPFKPNGRKPVLCSNCFKKGDGASSRSSYGNDRPFSNDKAGGSDMAQIVLQMKVMNSKLDTIIEALAAGE